MVAAKVFHEGKMGVPPPLQAAVLTVVVVVRSI